MLRAAINRPVRVLNVAPCQGAYGGIEAVVLAIAKAMAREPGIEMKVSFKKVAGFDLREGLLKAAGEMDITPMFVDKCSPELLRQIRWADVVHSHNAPPDVVLPARFLGKKVCVTHHNWRQPGLAPRQLLWRLCSRLAHRRWYNSDFVWNTWEPSGRCSHSGKLPVVSELPEGMVDPVRRKGFLFLARWIPNKGLETLLDAYESASIDRNAFPLTLVGDGPLRTQIALRLSKKPIYGVLDCGFVTMKERNQLLRSSKWLVAPPNTREDLGLTPIEARHVGVPCIVSEDGGLPEAAGKEALLCAPGNVAELRNCLERAAEMPEAEYHRRAKDTRLELLRVLQPMAVYADAYRELFES